jgi:hypothetical protein
MNGDVRFAPSRMLFKKFNYSENWEHFGGRVGWTCAYGAASPIASQLVEQGSKAHTLSQNKKAPLRGFLCFGGGTSHVRRLLSHASALLPALSDSTPGCSARLPFPGLADAIEFPIVQFG